MADEEKAFASRSSTTRVACWASRDQNMQDRLRRVLGRHPVDWRR